MKSPRLRPRNGLAWLIATLVLASCAHRPPVREADDSLMAMRSEYLMAHPEGTFNRNIERGEVTPGMRFEDVLASWGIPDARERAGTGERERWSYTLSDPWSRDWVRYDLLFEQKRLTAWEMMRNVASSHPLMRVTPERTPEVPASASGLVTSGGPRR